MAIEILDQPKGSGDAGIFNLPHNFDNKRYAAEWVLETQVSFKRQRQVIVGAGKTADGWEIWKADGNSEPTVVTAAGNKRFVLMCRPQEIQKAVNAIYGNVSKGYITGELQSKTVAGNAPQDPGVLTDERLKAAEGGSSMNEGTPPPNKVWDGVPQASAT